DRVGLQQVVLNLLLNAMEAVTGTGDGGGRIVVTTETTSKDGLHLAVRDNGAGLAGCLDRLFEPFFTTKTDGMGMGLPIARSIIEAHGGIIWATDHPVGGAIFHVALPSCTIPVP